MNIAQYEAKLEALFFADSEDKTTGRMRYGSKYPGVPYSEVATMSRRAMLESAEGLFMVLKSDNATFEFKFGALRGKPYMVVTSYPLIHFGVRSHRDDCEALKEGADTLLDVIQMLEDFKAEFGAVELSGV